MLFWDLALPTLRNSGFFHDSTRPRLHSDGLPPIRRLHSALQVLQKKQVILVWPGDAHPPIVVQEEEEDFA